MQVDSPQIRLNLARDELATLTDALHTKLDCLDGVAWITIDGDPRDVVLTRGESFVVDRPSNVIVFAMGGPAAVELRAGAA